MATGDLSAERISSLLRTERFGRALHVYDSVVSTNDLARQLADEGAAEGTAVIAKEQAAGRGRGGRAWLSPPGGLWLSVLLRPTLPVEEWPLLGVVLALASCRAVETVAGLRTGVKWPNDVMVGPRKLGGILVEATPAFAIGGIGLNANLTDAALPDPVGILATSIQMETGRGIDLNVLAAAVLSSSEEYYRRLPAEKASLLAEFRDRSVVLGRRVHITGSASFDGLAEAIDESGALLVRTPAGLQVLRAGEVSIRVAE